jgi:CarboxypepD_reg-like domain/TonB-dependent Receptor Plug Domain
VGMNPALRNVWHSVVSIKGAKIWRFFGDFVPYRSPDSTVKSRDSTIGVAGRQPSPFFCATSSLTNDLFMTIRQIFLLLLLLGGFSPLFAQQVPKYTLSGTVRDADSGEELIGVTLKISGVGGTTNEYGFFSLTLPEGDYTLTVNYVGYQTLEQPVVLRQNTVLDLRLGTGATLQEVTISAQKAGENITRTEMGMEKLNMREISQIPMLFGERDILKTIQMLPGVKSAGDGNSGFFVRGGGLDQNLILLDEAPVYNASHLLGFFSTFNSDAIKDATIYKGNQPAQYGGRLSSVLDVKMNEGNDKEYHVNGGIGLISSRITVEGPIVPEKGSFLISGRRTYADAFLALSNDENLSNNTLYFYDLNAKANYRINDKNRVFLSGYLGRDKMGLGDRFGIDWGNQTATLRWNHLFNQQLFSNTSLIFSKYDFKVNILSGENDFSIVSGIKDWNLKQELQWYPSPEHKFRFGANAIYHTITPGEIFSGDSTVFNGNELQERYALENAVWASGEWAASSRWNVAYGLRAGAFMVLGPGDFYTFDSSRQVTAIQTYNSNEVVKTYYSLEPRLSASYVLDKNSSIKASYSRNTQNMRLLSNSTSGNPTDRWTSATNNVKPGFSDLVSLGWYRNFNENAYEFSVETYYKWLHQEVDYRNDADLFGNPYYEADLIYGTGRAYGAEFYLKKKTGKLTGWISYTLSKTERQFAEVNDGAWFSARQDRTHDLAVVGMYQLSPRWSLSANFIYYTGDAATFPSGKYDIQNNPVFLYSERNGYRMPDYHRLDVGATWKGNTQKRWQSEWAFSIYNVYARENAYSITFEQDADDPTRTNAVKTALFKMIPSVSYNFKF